MFRFLIQRSHYLVNTKIPYDQYYSDFCPNEIKHYKTVWNSTKRLINQPSYTQLTTTLLKEQRVVNTSPYNWSKIDSNKESVWNHASVVLPCCTLKSLLNNSNVLIKRFSQRDGLILIKILTTRLSLSRVPHPPLRA